MRPGELSPPIRSGAGYYLLLVLDRRTGRSGPSDDEAVLHLVQVVFPLPPQASEAMRRAALAEAQNARGTAKNCEEMLKIGKEKGSAQLSSEGRLRTSQIAPAVRNIVGALERGQASQPIVQKNGVGVIMVCEKAVPNTALPTREEIAEPAGAPTRRELGTPLPARSATYRLCGRQSLRRARMPPLVVTMGEPAGIGGEIVLKAWLGRRDGIPPFYLIDDPERIAALARRLSWSVPVRPIDAPEEALAVFAEALPVAPIGIPLRALPGHPDPADAPAILSAIETGVGHVLSGKAAALVTNPIHKDSLYRAGFPHPGHTEYLAAIAGVAKAPVMMLVCPALRVVPVTIHLALRQAIRELSTMAIVHAGRVTEAALRRDFGVAIPTLAVAGLNPHAGEAGGLGREEIEIIEPAITALRTAGIDVRGPLAADTMFHAEARQAYDAALCMYHDQALIPIKTIDFTAE